MFREHCSITSNGVLVKDLRIIANRNIKNMVLVDNSILSFGFQLGNGIPILPFLGNSADSELMKLAEYLDNLLGVQDVRYLNRKVFKMALYKRFGERPDILGRKIL